MYSLTVDTTDGSLTILSFHFAQMIMTHPHVIAVVRKVRTLVYLMIMTSADTAATPRITLPKIPPSEKSVMPCVIPF